MQAVNIIIVGIIQPLKLLGKHDNNDTSLNKKIDQ